MNTSPLRRTLRHLALLVRLVRGPFLVGAVGVLALTLGYSGYRSLPGVHLSVGDALYQSLQLFALDSSAEGSIPWQLDIARFLAPAAIGYAAIVTVITLAQDQAQRAWTRLFAADHLVIVGLGRRGTALARRMRRARAKVVAVERQGSNGSISGLRSRGVAVIVGDGRDTEVLDLASVSRAQDVLVLTGDDSVNLEVLATCEQVTRSQTMPALHVAIEDPVLWSQLHRIAFGQAGSARRVEFLNIADRIARELVAVGHRVGQGAWPQLAIAGVGPAVDRVIVNGLRSGAVADREPAVALYGRARDRLAMLELQEPWLFDVAKFSTEDLSSADVGDSSRAGVLHPGLREQPPTLGVVCGVPEAEALSLAGLLVAVLPKESEVIAAVPSVSAQEALERTNFDLSRVTLVAAEEAVLSSSVVAESATELIARAKHDDYVRELQSRGETATTNSSLVPWGELAASLKESNRKFADSIGAKLEELGAVLTPLRRANPAPLDLPSETLETMARGEHERWVDDLKADDWRHTTGEKDAVQKLHPLLVPWKQLSEKEREKDRDGIRALPRLLATVGYEVTLPDRPSADRR